MSETFKYNCPHCGASFTNEDVDRAKAGKAYYILNKHGMSIRSIGRLFNVHPQSVKYHIGKFNKMSKMPPVWSETSEWGEREMEILKELDLPAHTNPSEIKEQSDE